MGQISPSSSRAAGVLFGLITIGHALVATDLVFNYFPATTEIVALWATPVWVKSLWAVLTALGVTAVLLLYRLPVLGFIASLALTVCLYFASIGLWHDIKGTFCIALGALAFAAFGAWTSWRSDHSFKPTSLRDAD